MKVLDKVTKNILECNNENVISIWLKDKERFQEIKEKSNIKIKK